MTTLADLHLLVPAAEALDAQDPGGQLSLAAGARAPEPGVALDPPPTPTHAQAVAIVQRYLGGRVIG